MREPDSLSKREVIRHAAVKSKCGNIFIGKCHADCFGKGFESGFKMSSKACDQGFITSHGRYVERPEAARIAFSSDQIEKCTPALFSEDLWSNEENGKYDHDEIKGYILKNAR